MTASLCLPRYFAMISPLFYVWHNCLMDLGPLLCLFLQIPDDDSSLFNLLSQTFYLMEQAVLWIRIDWFNGYLPFLWIFLGYMVNFGYFYKVDLNLFSCFSRLVACFLLAGSTPEELLSSLIMDRGTVAHPKWRMTLSREWISTPLNRNKIKGPLSDPLIITSPMLSQLGFQQNWSD